MTDTSRYKNICIFGAGAVGATLAARLASAPGLQDRTISVVARGAHLAAIREGGIRLYDIGASDPIVAPVEATDKAAELGPQDVVFVTLKGHQLSAASDDIASLLKPGGRVVMIQNGIPWWYFHADKASGHEGFAIEALDPGEHIRRTIGPERVIGGVIYQGAQVRQPGHVHLASDGVLYLGEPSGAMSEDLLSITALVDATAWTATATPRIRDAMWEKLQGNAAINPLNALTRASMADIVHGPVSPLARQIMQEVQTVAEALGARLPASVDAKMESSGLRNTVKTSMLQDVEQGRRLEIAPLTLGVTLLGRIAGVPTPANDTVLALISELDRSLALARGEKI